VRKEKEGNPPDQSTNNHGGFDFMVPVRADAIFLNCRFKEIFFRQLVEIQRFAA